MNPIETLKWVSGRGEKVHEIHGLVYITDLGSQVSVWYGTFLVNILVKHNKNGHMVYINKYI